MAHAQRSFRGNTSKRMNSPNSTSDSLFCHCCRVHHPKNQMSRYLTRYGYRWRCLQSIAGARGSAAERDAFGRRQTEINRELARLKARRVFELQEERRLQP